MNSDELTSGSVQTRALGEGSDPAESSRNRLVIRWRPLAILSVALALAALGFGKVLESARSQVWYTSPRLPVIHKRVTILKPADWEVRRRRFAGPTHAVIIEPARRSKWLRIPFLRKLLNLDDLEKQAYLLLSVNPPALAFGPQIAVKEYPASCVAMVGIEHKGKDVLVMYVRTNKQEFRRTYREILQSVRFIE